jgi:hypothetical protein
MTQKIQTALHQALAGETFQLCEDEMLEVLEEMRRSVSDSKALRELGLATVAILNAHFRSLVVAEKALAVAKGGDHE